MQVYFIPLCYILFWALVHLFIKNLRSLLKKNQYTIYRQSSKPGTDSSKLGTNSSIPSKDSSKPGKDSSNSGTDSNKPGTDNSIPGTDSSKPGTDVRQVKNCLFLGAPDFIS